MIQQPVKFLWEDPVESLWSLEMLIHQLISIEFMDKIIKYIHLF